MLNSGTSFHSWAGIHLGRSPLLLRLTGGSVRFTILGGWLAEACDAVT